MSYDDYQQNTKNGDAQAANPMGNGSSRFEEAKQQEQQGQYNRHYQRMATLLGKGVLDFKMIAKETGLKERKIRDTLLSRLTTDDMIQLFGHKEGICYICGARMRGNFTQEPLCLLCIEIIGSKVKELYPPEIQATTTASTEDIRVIEAAPAISSAAISSKEMVSKEEYEAILNEVHQYRDKYGPIDADDANAAPSHAVELETQEPAEALDTSVESENIFDILHIEEGPDSDTVEKHSGEANGQPSPSEPIRHFGFQRLKSRN